MATTAVTPAPAPAPAASTDKAPASLGTFAKDEHPELDSTESSEAPESDGAEASTDGTVETAAGDDTQQAAPADKETRLMQMAEEYGVDLTDAGVRKLLEAQYTAEQRAADKDAHISKIESAQVDDWVKEFDSIRERLGKSNEPEKP